MKKGIIYLLVIWLCCASCNSPSRVAVKSYEPLSELFDRSGRVEAMDDGSLALIGPASSLEFNASGDSIIIRIQSQFESGNSFVVAIDDVHLKRYLLKDEFVNDFSISMPDGEMHKVGLFKATEAATGNLIVHQVEAESIVDRPEKEAKTIEFIGNSITCGAAADTETIPCGTGYYHDQHNAYLAYGPRTARELGLNYFLSSVSGIGIYRNWNDENLLEPIMPEVYENLYLNGMGQGSYDFSVMPDIVSICLGTNDLSGGDGIKNRSPFDRDKFIGNYIEFVKMLRTHYPKARIVLLSSPILKGKSRSILIECLKTIKESLGPSIETQIFVFEPMDAHGCTGHPSVEDHQEIAEALIPFFRKILEE